MSETRRKYRVQVFQRGDADPSTGTVDYTFYDGDGGQTSTLGTVPVVREPEAEPLEGKTTTLRSTFDVVDKDEVFTAEFADANERMHVLGRLARVQYAESTDGGATFGSWTTLGVGRLSSVSEGHERGRYRVELSDERWVERRAPIWTSAEDTTRLMPAGLNAEYGLTTGGNSRIADTQPAAITPVLDADHVVVTVHGGKGALIPEVTADYIKGDLVSEVDERGGQGNFQTLRLNVDDGSTAADYEIVNFSDTLNVDLGEFFEGIFDAPDESDASRIHTMVIHASGHSFSEDDPVDVYLHAPSAVASEATPHHIGGQNGLHPFQLLKNAYDGDYSPSGVSVRYDSTAMTALINDDRYGPVRLRNLETTTIAEAAERHCYKPYGVVPFIGADGEIVPKSVWLPQDTDPTTLTTITAADCQPGGLPSWDHGAREAVTVVRGSYLLERDPRAGQFFDSADQLRVLDIELPEDTHDNITTFGRREVTLELAGYHDFADAIDVYGELKREVYDRWGDGPIRGTMTLRESSGASVAAGDHIVLDQDTLKGPNPATNARSGDRVVLVTRRVVSPAGIEVEYLDAGPTDQPLSAPTVSVAQNGSSPSRKVDVTLSSFDADATGYQLFIDRGGGKSWVAAREGTGAETVTISRCLPNTLTKVKAYATAENRIRSAFSAVDSVTTAAFSAPTGLSTTVNGTQVKGEWTVGEADVPVEVLLDGTRVRILSAGAEQYTIRGLDPLTPYNSPGYEVRHRRRSGEVSTSISDSFTTGTKPTAPDMNGIALTKGVQPGDGPTGVITGVYIALYPGDPDFRIRIQRAPDSAGSPDTANKKLIATVRGSTPVHFDPQPEDGATWHYRASHTRDGYNNGTPTAWKPIVMEDVDDGGGNGGGGGGGIEQPPPVLFQSVRKIDSGVVPADEVFDTTNNDLDDVGDGTTHGRVQNAYLDSNRPNKLRRSVGAVDVDADDVFDTTRETADDVGDGTNRRTAATSHTDASGRPTLLRRIVGAVDVDADDVFDTTRETLDDAPDGTTYARTKASELDTGRVKKVFKATSAISVDAEDVIDRTNDDLDALPDGTTHGKVKNAELSSGQVKRVRDTVNARNVTGDQVFDKGANDLDDVSDGSTHGKVQNSYLDGNRPSKLRRAVGAVDVDADDVFDTTRETADDVGDGSSKRVTTLNEADGGNRAHGALNSSNRLKNQTHMPMVTTGNRKSQQDPDPFLTVLSATDAGTDATITINAHDLKMGGTTVSYSGDSITGLSFNTTYFIYADDATFGGGSVTYQQTTDPLNVVGNDGRYYVGKITTPTDGGGDTGGGGGGGTPPLE